MAKTRSELNRQATAGARYLRISPPKLNQVAALIRGVHVDEARRILAFTPKAASHEISKVLEAAIANAEHNHDLAAHELFVKEVTADEGPTLKRFRPRALGRAYRIRKRTSHLHIVVERRGTEPAPRPAGSAGAEPAGRRWRRGQGEAAASGAAPKAPRTRAGLRAARRAGPKTESRGEAKGGGRRQMPRPAKGGN
ncbi:MAG TPA: 50S ribosomal protein L22 [Actinomycetota bacterium]|jgi:large subunit ribosomal protein L22